MGTLGSWMYNDGMSIQSNLTKDILTPKTPGHFSANFLFNFVECILILICSIFSPIRGGKNSNT